jgi:homoserine O-acetyltransferase
MKTTSRPSILTCLASIFALGFLILALPPAAPAHSPTQPPHQLYRMGDLKLESGEVITDFAISYVTHGTLNAKKSNAILMVPAISGNHHRLDFLIGPGKALDTNKYFIVAADAIANGLTTSPSNSKAQPRMQFPRFNVRDIVQSQYRLLTEHLGIGHLVAVIGPSFGGMQALQWGVSYPAFMDSLVPIVPLAKTPTWTTLLLETTRKAIMLDPAWDNGNYTSLPEGGIRLWRDILVVVMSRNPTQLRSQFPDGEGFLPWLKTMEDSMLKAFDPNDYLYQTWAYDAHDIGATPGMKGSLIKAAQAIKAKTLILTGVNDLLNPEWEPIEAARYMPDARCVTINPSSVTGHFAGSGLIPADVEFLNREIGDFFEIVTNRGKKLE